MYTAVLLVALLIHLSTAINPFCDYYFNVLLNQTVYVYSPNYPGSYPRPIECRWQAVCPNNTKCRLNCLDIDIPQTQNCSVDRLLISNTGDPTLTQAEYYCGYGTLVADSVGSRMSVGLVVNGNSPGGRFYCELTAVPSTPPPQPSCSCGYQKLDRIVGGVISRPGEFPMMAGIIYVSQREIRCGATIIDQKFVLTAAHCVISRQLSDLGVIVGEYDTSTGTDSPATQAFQVASVLTHPQYTSTNYDYDIAIVRIVGQMVFSEYVGPACLPFKFAGFDFAGTKVTAMGWGTDSPGGPKSNVLMKVELDVISQTTCRLRVPILTTRQMCTFTRGKDSCQDDSGGPLLYRDPATGLLFHAGIVSYGRFCASADPGVNTRITSLLNWIVNNAPSNYCIYRAVLLVVLLIHLSTAIDPSCDYYFNVQSNQTVYMYSPNYPNSYPRPIECRWQAVCPNNTKCSLNCLDIDMPQTQNCSVDRLLISNTGDPTLTQAEYYCGYGTLVADSIGSRMSVGLVVDVNSPGGRFYCELTAVPSTLPPQPSCSCGYQKEDRIVGGVISRPGEFPMMAGIIYVSQREIRCGATIIDQKYVLTAAHCVISRQLSDLGVIVGEYDTSTGNDSQATQAFQVASVLTHPQYTSTNYDYDIAIVTIVGEMAFSLYVGPACLPFKFADFDFAGTKVTAMGWGTDSPGGPKSDVLMKVELDVISQTTCQLSFPTLTTRQMCTFTPGKDSCQDDSGGPLIYRDPATGILFHVGIVSYGRFCASYEPGVNTRITSLLNWIVNNAPSNYCVK